VSKLLIARDKVTQKTKEIKVDDNIRYEAIYIQVGLPSWPLLRHVTNKLYFTARQKYKNEALEKITCRGGSAGYRCPWPLHLWQSSCMQRGRTIFQETTTFSHTFRSTVFLGRNRVNVPVHQGTLASGIGSLQSIPRFHKSLKLWAQNSGSRKR
jgi:hypothetical protein